MNDYKERRKTSWRYSIRIAMSEFREMRRKRQQLSEEESISILKKATAGTLALLKKIDKS